MSKRLEKQEDEAAFLRRIVAQHAIYESSRRTEAILLHTHHTLKLLQAEERCDNHATSLKRLEAEHADDLKQLAEATTVESNAKTMLDQVRFEIGKDPDAVKIAEQESAKAVLQEKVTDLRSAQLSVRKQLDDRHYRWVNWLKHGDAL